MSLVSPVPFSMCEYRYRYTLSAGWTLLLSPLELIALGSLNFHHSPTEQRYIHNILVHVHVVYKWLFCQDYHAVVDTNLPSHFYRFTRPELSVSGCEDTHITVDINVEISTLCCIHIAASSACTTKLLSKLLTQCLKLVLKHYSQYCADIERKTGINCFWVVKNSTDILNSLTKVHKASHLDSFDFSTLYTKLPIIYLRSA